MVNRPDLTSANAARELGKELSDSAQETDAQLQQLMERIGIDTGWQPHGGTVAANIGVGYPIEWRIRRGVVYWRGQFYRSGGFPAGSDQLLLSGLPTEVWPSVAMPLTVRADLGVISVLVRTDGRITFDAQLDGSAWPYIGGCYPQG